ncbi:MAG: L-lactate dehydrogenase [Phycisphaerae bacterium]
MKTGTISIVGVGSVGAAIAYATMIRGLGRRIVLVDKNHTKARGEALDLGHCSPFVPVVEVEAAPLDAIVGSDVVVVTAGAKQKPGQSRRDLVETNVNLFRELIPQIIEKAPDAWLLIVSNPVDALTYAALRFSRLPPTQVAGTGTVLDTARFRHLIGRRINVSPSSVHAYVVGEHGDSEIGLFSGAMVGGVPLPEFEVDGQQRLTDSDRADILEATRKAAGEIIAAKGATNWAIGLTTARILEAYLRDENAVLTVSRLLENYVGRGDVCMSVPSIVSRQGVGPALSVAMSEAEATGLQKSAETIRGVIERAGLR